MLILRKIYKFVYCLPLFNINTGQKINLPNGKQKSIVLYITIYILSTYIYNSIYLCLLL